jgi:hypothetical protein
MRGGFFMLDQKENFGINKDTWNIDKKKRILSQINNDPWLVADYGCLIDQLLIECESNNSLTKRGRKPGKVFSSLDLFVQAVKPFFINNSTYKRNQNYYAKKLNISVGTISNTLREFGVSWVDIRNLCNK